MLCWALARLCWSPANRGLRPYSPLSQSTSDVSSRRGAGLIGRVLVSKDPDGVYGAGWRSTASAKDSSSGVRMNGWVPTIHASATEPGDASTNQALRCQDSASSRLSEILIADT